MVLGTQVHGLGLLHEGQVLLHEVPGDSIVDRAHQTMYKKAGFILSADHRATYGYFYTSRG